MTDRETGRLTALPAPTWVMLIGAVLVILVLIVVTADREGRPGRSQPVRQAEADGGRTKAPVGDPVPVKVIRTTVWAAVICSYLWLLLAVVRSGRRAFGPAALLPARWNELDAAAVVLFFYVLLNLCAMAVAGGGLETIYAVDGLSRLAAACMVLQIIRRRGQDPRDVLGLRLRGLARHVISGLAVFLALLPVLTVAHDAWRWLLELLYVDRSDMAQELVVELMTTPSVPVLLQIVIAAVLVAPLTEELFFRGFLYGAVRRHVRPAIAMVAVGVLFGVVHPPLAAQVPMCVLGTLLCYLYEKTGRLTVPIAVHFLFNLRVVAVIILYRHYYGAGL